MIRQMVLAGAMTGLCFAAPLEAQRAAPGSFGITPYAGYIKFGNIANGPLGTSLRNAGAAVYGAEMSLGLAPTLALVGNVAYSQPDLQIGAPLVGGISVGQSSVLLYDAALRLRVPTGGLLPISPFVQAGAGAVRQSVSVSPVSTHSTSFAYNVGAGADVAIAPRSRSAADGEGLHRKVRCEGSDGTQPQYEDDAQLGGECGSPPGSLIVKVQRRGAENAEVRRVNHLLSSL